MSKKIIRLTESDLVRMVKRVIKESDEKSTFELKMETTPEEQLDSVIQEFFANKTEAETKEYFMELNNKKPKWLKKLLRHFVNPKNKNKKISGGLAFYSILFMLKQIFGVKLKELLGLPSKIVGIDEQKRPHHGDNKTIQYARIQNFDNLGKIQGLSKNSSGDAYIGKSGNFSYTFKANGTNGNGTYYVNNKPGQWKFDNDSTACASNLPNCRIFKGVKLITPVSSK
jgi:hypothetical protein